MNEMKNGQVEDEWRILIGDSNLNRRWQFQTI